MTARIVETANHKSGRHYIALYIDGQLDGYHPTYEAAMTKVEEIRPNYSEAAWLMYRYVYISAKTEWKHEEWKEI